MIACVSPPRTVRSTPRRISRGSPSALTETWRSRISRVAMMGAAPDLRVCCGNGSGNVDEHVTVEDGDRIDGDRHDRRGPGGRAADKVESRAVQPAFDGVAVDLTVGEADVRMGADVIK